MSDINIYMNAEDKVNVKDDTQIIKLQGPKGEPGEDGKPFTYDMFTQEQLEALKGPKGDKGEDGRDGASVTADNAKALLLQGNVWCKSSNIDDVLIALIGNMGKPFPRNEFKPLKVPNVFRGQRVVRIEGEPHYFVKVANMETPFEIGDNGECVVSIEPLGEDDVKLTYHNFTGDKVGDYTIKGVVDENTVQPDETYEELGSKYFKYGRKLVINVTNQKTTSNWTEDNFNFLGKWQEKDIDSIEIVNNSKKKTYLYLNSKGLPRVPIFVNKPELITFNHTLSPSGNTTVNIGTRDSGISTVNFVRDTLEWSENNNRYINTGIEPL